MRPRSNVSRPQRATVSDIRLRPVPVKTQPVISVKTQPSIPGRWSTPTRSPLAAKTKTATAIKLPGAAGKPRTESSLGGPPPDKPKAGKQPTPAMIAGIAGGVLVFLLLLILVVSASGPSRRPLTTTAKPRTAPVSNYNSNKRRYVPVEFHPQKAKPIQELDGKTMADYMRENELDKNKLLVERQERVRDYETRGKRAKTKPPAKTDDSGDDDESDE